MFKFYGSNKIARMLCVLMCAVISIIMLYTAVTIDIMNIKGITLIALQCTVIVSLLIESFGHRFILNERV